MSLHLSINPSLFFQVLHWKKFISRKESFSELNALFEFVSGEFSMFFGEIWRECCPIITQENKLGEFSFFASSKSSACQKQNKQLIKISPQRLYLEKGRGSNSEVTSSRCSLGNRVLFWENHFCFCFHEYAFALYSSVFRKHILFRGLGQTAYDR